jgi:hypothetical protein
MSALPSDALVFFGATGDSVEEVGPAVTPPGGWHDPVPSPTPC